MAKIDSPMVLQDTCNIFLAQCLCNRLPFLCRQNNAAMVFVNTDSAKEIACIFIDPVSTNSNPQYHLKRNKKQLTLCKHLNWLSK